MSRSRPRRALAWVIVTAMAIAACGSDGGLAGGGEGPLDEQLTAAITAFWEGTGVPTDLPIRFGYKYRTHRGTRSCQHLPEDDRWYAERTSVLNLGERDQATMMTATVAYLEREGFTISRWKTSSTTAPVAYGFIGHRDTTAIEVDIDATGRTDLAVRMGPCATPTLDEFTQPLYQRIG